MFFNIFIIIINFLILLNFKKISKFVNIYDQPDNIRKKHTNKISVIGSIFVLINLNLYLIISLIEPSLPYFYLPFLIREKISLLFLINSMFFVGLIDDRYDLRAEKKTIIFFLIIIVTFLSSKGQILNFLNFKNPSDYMNLYDFGYIFTFLCVFIFLNAFNMFDGIDLQIFLYSLFLLSFLVLKGIYFNLNVIVSISLFFFGYLNFKKISFLGNSGSYMVSSFFSFIFIKLHNNFLVFADEIVLLFFIPTIDLLRLFIIRIYNGKNPLKADNNHIHHIFQKKINNKFVPFCTVLMCMMPILFFNFLNINFYISLFFASVIYISSLVLFYYSKN